MNPGSLKAVVDELQVMGDGIRALISRTTGEIIEVADEDDWYRYRDDALARIARDFLEVEGIPYVDDCQQEEG